MKYERIVVAVDFSESSLRATRWVANVFAPAAELVLAHVIDIPGPPGILRDLAAPTDVLEATAREGSERKLRDVSREANVKRSWIEVRRGAADETLSDIAADYNADLIVVGSHRERDGIRNRLGTTAERVIAHSRVPVLLAANPADKAPTHVLAAIDGSEISSEVVAWANSVAAGSNAATTRLSVVSSAAPSVSVAHASVAEQGPSAAGRDEWIARELVADADSAVLPEVTFGEPAKEILAAAARYGSGLIVVGRRGAGRARRALFGSVTREVLRGATCPVLVVVEGSEANVLDRRTAP
jgi:nucleotide-binding universal stress UspA family protein